MSGPVDRLREVTDCLQDPVAGFFVPLIAALQIEAIRVIVLGWPLRQALSLAGREAEPQLLGDPA